MVAINRELERKLIAEIRAGREAGFEELVKHYQQPVINYLFRLLGQREEAEDSTQETFIKVYTNFHRYDQKRRFSTWLFTIATRVAYDQLRRRHHLTIGGSDQIDQLSETKPARASYNQVEQRLDLEAALRTLPHEYRTPLLLYYQQSMSYQQICEVTGLSVGTVRTRLRRAKIRLRQLLI